MPTLVLPPRYTPDSIALASAAAEQGWSVERLSSWRPPAWLAGEEVVLYGEPLSPPLSPSRWAWPCWGHRQTGWRTCPGSCGSEK